MNEFRDFAGLRCPTSSRRGEAGAFDVVPLRQKRKFSRSSGTYSQRRSETGSAGSGSRDPLKDSCRSDRITASPTRAAPSHLRPRYRKLSSYRERVNPHKMPRDSARIYSPRDPFGVARTMDAKVKLAWIAPDLISDQMRLTSLRLLLGLLASLARFPLMESLYE